MSARRHILSSRPWALLALLVLPLGCRPDPVPLADTSLSLAAGDDPGKPAQKVSLLWVHGGAADRLLSRSVAAELRANNIVLRQIRAGQGKVGNFTIGDHTSPGDWPKIFSDEKRLSTLETWRHPASARHDIVMFGGDSRGAEIENEQTLGRYKGWYRGLIRAFRSRRRTLFVPLTPAPRIASATNPAAASRARRFADWLRLRYAPKELNVVAFDLFRALAIREKKPKANTLAPQFSGGSGSEVSTAGAKAVGRLLIPFINRQIERLALGRGAVGAAPRGRRSGGGKASGDNSDWRRARSRKVAAEAKRLERAKRQLKEGRVVPARPARTVGEKYYPARPAQTFDPPIPPRRRTPKGRGEGG
jgi:hypothetical protein